MEIDWSWITTSGTSVLMVVLSAVGIYAALVLFTRLAGLRSFSKMSSFDFAITVAFGTILASTLLTGSPPLLQGIAGLAALYLIQYGVSRFRRPPGPLSDLVDNKPLLLAAEGEVLQENLEEGRMTREDLRAKLREANVQRWDQVRAVVMETTGDVSVLHAEPGDPPMDPDLLDGVRGADRLR